MLGRRDAMPVSLIVSQDDLSWPGERHLWIFVVRGKGIYDVFLIEITGARHQHYELQNSATIRWDGRTVGDFQPLLGSVWTHEVVRLNFGKALKSEPILLRPFAPSSERVDCGTYASPGKFH